MTTYAQLTTEANKAYIAPTLRTSFGGFVLDLLQDEVIDLSSSSTDHIVEDNSTINDHITNEKTRIQLMGIVSDINLRPDTTPTKGQPEEHRFNNQPEAMVDKQDSAGTKQAQRHIEEAERPNQQNEEVTPTDNIYGNSQSRIIGNRQQKLVAFIQGIRKTKTLVSIKTRVGFFTNMHIESFTMQTSQTDETQSIVNIGFSEFRFAKTLSTAVDKVALGRSNALAQKLEQGSANGKKKPYQSRLSAGVSSITN
jgi:hypothetical protein